MNSIRTAYRFVVGLDLGQKIDYTAVSVLRQHRDEDKRSSYDCIYLDRWRERSYQDVVPAFQQLTDMLTAFAHEQYREAGLVNQPKLPIRLCVDFTGVGRAVLDTLRANRIKCTGVTITSGGSVTVDGGNFRVPKRELVATLQLLTESRRLNVAGELPLASVLVEEMGNFRSKTNPTTGYDSYGAGEEWREGNHDDLVLATAIAAWYGETRREPGRIMGF